MEMIKELAKKQRYTMEEVMTEVLNHHGVQQFLNQYKDYIDDEMIRTGASVLNEFVRSQNDPRYQAKLFLYNGQISITYSIIETPELLKYRDRVPSKSFYDIQTAKYKGVRLKDYDITMDNQAAVGYIDNFIKTYKYGDNSKGIWLLGKFGRGKTYLMGCLATELSKKQVGINFVSVAQLMNDLYETMRQNSLDNSVQKQIGYLQKSEVLILDDLGTEKITRNNVVDVLYSILKYRGENKKPTFITSNLAKDQYCQLLLDSGIDRMSIGRLKEQLDVLTKEILMTGENRRDKA